MPLLVRLPRAMLSVKKPEAGDVIILLGGKTGRDGVGGATGSSKVQTVESVETAGAEVQKRKCHRRTQDSAPLP